MTRTCNVCDKTKDFSLMIPHVQYKSGYAPLCRDCSKKKCLDYWKKHYVHKRVKGKNERIRNWSKRQDLSILIKNGYARNEEEAREYAKW